MSQSRKCHGKCGVELAEFMNEDWMPIESAVRSMSLGFGTEHMGRCCQSAATDNRLNVSGLVS